MWAVDAFNLTTANSYYFIVNDSYPLCNDGSTVDNFLNLTVICKCPAYSTYIAPCVCGPTKNSEGVSSTLTISCAAQSLGDSALSDIFKNVSSTSPVDTMNLSGNQLTKIPSGLPQYETLVSVTVANNSITSVGSTDLSLSGNVTLIDLSYNQISVIAPGSLPGTKIKVSSKSKQ